jgi:hypothetical protein
VKVTMIGSCFCGFLKKPLTELSVSQNYTGIAPLEFQTHTIWHRIDTIVDILDNKVLDDQLVKYFIEKGKWHSRGERNSEWFAREIVSQNENARKIVNDVPDLLIFDSLPELRHSLYRHKKYGWKCFLGAICFEQSDIQERFDSEFEFIHLLDVEDIKRCIKAITHYFKSKNKNLKTVYIQFPATAGYIEDKWVARAEELKKAVKQLENELDKRQVYHLIFPEEMVKPITDPSHPNYSPQIWNHFHAEAYDYAANRILEWYTQKSRSRFLRNSLPKVFFSRR